jgi:hypothetical protein
MAGELGREVNFTAVLSLSRSVHVCQSHEVAGS